MRYFSVCRTMLRRLEFSKNVDTAGTREKISDSNGKAGEKSRSSFFSVFTPRDLSDYSSQIHVFVTIPYLHNNPPHTQKNSGVTHKCQSIFRFKKNISIL